MKGVVVSAMSDQTGIRKSVYLRKGKDQDIIEYIEPKMKYHDFSGIIRDLVRDGIRYRQGVVQQSMSVEMSDLVLQSNTRVLGRELQSFLQDTKLEDKAVTDTDLEDRLDSF